MLFSSITFLYYFLPLLLLIYFIVGKKYKNLVLLIFSFLFFFYGEPKHIIILILSIVVNYIFGILIYKYRNKSKFILIISLIFNISLLVYFKYTNFIIENINNIFKGDISYLNIVMPIGISFFTFQTLSYVIDVYRKDVKASYNLLNFATYVSLFPQLVAGPIVRYKDVNEELLIRKSNYSLFANGVERFSIGLAKKVLLANTLGEAAKTISALPESTTLGYILLAIFYTLQIYFDFSGYSDMAIGLGKMFGFNFKENFNYPLIAKSITDFWRRWHISLSSFFRDYIYIPLGGNRVSKIKWIRNIFVVWFLTGLWHGASWNFILWGLYFAIILLIEKLLLQKFIDKHTIFGHIYSLILIVISFVIFSSDTLNLIVTNLKGMFFMLDIPFVNNDIIYYFKSYLMILLL